ncbi:hypothetical protein [Streptomyces sp. NPDC060022]|uniref:hypothetical protein n=1 Tax=Streptomyces sp. NPDC060022 TaxID=3347039 RepID=UPI0036CA0C04
MTVGLPPAGSTARRWWVEDGVEITGSAPARIGLQVLVMHPEHAVLVHVTAVS